MQSWLYCVSVMSRFVVRIMTARWSTLTGTAALTSIAEVCSPERQTRSRGAFVRAQRSYWDLWEEASALWAHKGLQSSQVWQVYPHVCTWAGLASIVNVLREIKPKR